MTTLNKNTINTIIAAIINDHNEAGNNNVTKEDIVESLHAGYDWTYEQAEELVDSDEFDTHFSGMDRF